MYACCKTWLTTLAVRTPRKGKFLEKRQCPECRGWHMVRFQGGLGTEGLTCTVLGIKED